MRYCRWCGIAGGERVPPSPLGWYLIQESVSGHFIKDEELQVLEKEEHRAPASVFLWLLLIFAILVAFFVIKMTGFRDNKDDVKTPGNDI